MLSIRKSFGLYLFKLSRIQPLPNPSSAIAILQTTTISHLVCSGLFLCFHPCSWKSILITADFVIPFKYKSDHNTPLLKTLQWILFFTKRKSQIFTMAYKALHDLVPIASLTSAHSTPDIWAFLLFPKHARHASTLGEFPLCEIPLPSLSICLTSSPPSSLCSYITL